MILSDGEIKKRVTSDKLIEFHDPKQIKYCGCELTLGNAVAPKTGEVLSITDKPRHWFSNVMTAKKCFVIEPSETKILVTKERLNMPKDLCATYGQLNRLANKGLMILNTSIVEPQYPAPLAACWLIFRRRSTRFRQGIPSQSSHSTESRALRSKCLPTHTLTLTMKHWFRRTLYPFPNRFWISRA